DWRGTIGRGWTYDAAFQYGGFGVGTDVDVNGDFYADKHFGPHFLLRLGYTLVHLKTTIDKVQIGSFQRQIIASQTLNGPPFGFGFVFWRFFFAFLLGAAVGVPRRSFSSITSRYAT